MGKGRALSATCGSVVILSDSRPAARLPLAGGCPGRTPPFRAVKHPPRPSKNVIQSRCGLESAKGARPPRAGPDRDEAQPTVEDLARRAGVGHGRPGGVLGRADLGDGGELRKVERRLADLQPRTVGRPVSRLLGWWSWLLELVGLGWGADQIILPLQALVPDGHAEQPAGRQLRPLEDQ